MSTTLIILAAGKGSRMQSDLPKVLHAVAGAPLLIHAMTSGVVLEPEKTVIVAGHGAEAVGAVAREFDENVEVVVQADQLGTGHAVGQALPALAGVDGVDGIEGDAIILYGDTPFIRSETLQNMLDARRDHAVVVLGFEAADPARYGRLIEDGNTLTAIVEYKDATEAQREITLCNSGVICASIETLNTLIPQITNDNAAGEYYLPDVVALARAAGLSAGVVRCDEAETLGINTRAELARAEALFQTRARADAIEDGVNLIAPDTVYFSHDTFLGRDAIIEPNVVFAPAVTVESGATIRAFSHLEGCHVSRGSVVGPYARLRPGAELAEDVKIGNFVEVKNAQIDTGAKVSHLSYIGDASIGAGSNIGAGTITCNYDGVFKHRTQIGENVFVGSNTMLIAPVKLGDDSMTASGSVITKDVEDGALAVARAPQIVKSGLARRMFEKLKNKKKKLTKGA